MTQMKFAVLSKLTASTESQTEAEKPQPIPEPLVQQTDKVYRTYIRDAATNTNMWAPREESKKCSVGIQFPSPPNSREEIENHSCEYSTYPPITISDSLE